MSTITVPRPDVTTAEVVDALRRGLGSHYTVLPETGVNWNPAGAPRADHADSIVVGTGSARVFRAQVKVSHDAGSTTLRVSPGGLSLVPRLTNRLWIARLAGHVLRADPSLRAEV